jgi:hypothetical protein
MMDGFDGRSVAVIGKVISAETATAPSRRPFSDLRYLSPKTAPHPGTLNRSDAYKLPPTERLEHLKDLFDRFERVDENEKTV